MEIERPKIPEKCHNCSLALHIGSEAAGVCATVAPVILETTPGTNPNTQNAERVAYDIAKDGNELDPAVYEACNDVHGRLALTTPYDFSSFRGINY